MGGPTTLGFGYDGLYRLTSASGAYQTSPSDTRLYKLDMAYDNIHNIKAKNQIDTLTHAGGKPLTQKATTYDWAYTYDPSGHPHAPTHIGNRTFTYDYNGNQLGWKNDQNGTRRTILWDEENRIAQIDDNGERNDYTYDAGGQRVIKVGRQGETAYINQYYVVRNRSIVSKHIFAGASRIATHMEMGNGNSGNVRGMGGNAGGNGAGQGSEPTNPGQGDARRNDRANDHADNQTAQVEHGNAHGNSGHGHNADSTGTTISSNGAEAVLPGNSDQGLENALANGQGHKYGIYKHLEREGDTVVNGEIVAASGASATATTTQAQQFLYYYHPDHLGSTGFVTDAKGKLYEHESPRVLRRLQYPRRWSHEQIKEVFPRSTRTRSPYGAGASR